MKNKPARLAALIAAAILNGLSGLALVADVLANGFICPPVSAKPRFYWYFMDGDVTSPAYHLHYDGPASNRTLSHLSFT